MAITEDASTPAIATGTGTGNLTCASFSPPTNTLLVALVGGGWSQNAVLGATISDSVGGTWTVADTAAGPSGPAGGLAKIFYRYLSSAPGSMTVTAAYTNLQGGRMLAVRVLNGAASNQSAAAHANAVIATLQLASTISLTTTVTGSQVYGITDNPSTGNDLFTANAATTILASGQYADTTDSIRLVAWKGASPTGTPGATTFGGSWATTDKSNIVAFEVLPQVIAAGAATLSATSGLTAAAALPGAASTMAATSGFTADADLPTAAATLAATATFTAVAGVPTVALTLAATGGLTAETVYVRLAALTFAGVATLHAETLPPTTLAAVSALVTTGQLLPAAALVTLPGAATLTALGFSVVSAGAVLAGTAGIQPTLFTTWAGITALAGTGRLQAGTTLPGAVANLAAEATFVVRGYLAGGADWLSLDALTTLTATATAFTPALVYPAGPILHPVKTPTYRLYAADTRTGRIGWELPFSTCTWNNPINEAGSLRATLVVEEAFEKLYSQGALDPRETLRQVLTGPYRFSVVLAWGNAVAFAGPYLPSSNPGDTPTVDIGAAELLRLMDKRLLISPESGFADLTVGPSNASSLVLQIMNLATSGYGRELPVTCGNPPSSAGPYTMVFHWWDLKKASDALSDLTTLDDGPDFRLDPYLYTGSDGLYVAWELSIGSPYLGTGPWVFDDASAIISQDIDAAKMASTFYVPGSGQDEQKLTAYAVNTTLIDQGFPALEEVDGGYSSEADINRLVSVAGADVTRYTAPVDKWTVKVRADAQPPLGAYRVGDRMLVDIRRHPVIVPGTYLRRITEVAGDQSPWVSLSSTESTGG